MDRSGITTAPLLTPLRGRLVLVFALLVNDLLTPRLSFFFPSMVSARALVYRQRASTGMG